MYMCVYGCVYTYDIRRMCMYINNGDTKWMR